MLLIEEFTRFPKEQLLLLLDYLKHRSVKSKEHPNLRIMANTRIVCTSSEIANKEIWRYEGVIRSLVGFLEIRMDVPRLCRRMDEFESIAIELLKEICVELQKQHVLGFDAQAMLKLKQYLWPGNIRELRNVLKMAAMVTQTDQIQLFDLPEFEMNTTLFQANRENFEKAYILELLRTFEWDIQKTAERIRMNKDDLLFKIQHYGIDFEQENSKLLKS
jgi:DNA-binding NtrC family response regulator